MNLLDVVQDQELGLLGCKEMMVDVVGMRRVLLLAPLLEKFASNYPVPKSLASWSSRDTDRLQGIAAKFQVATTSLSVHVEGMVGMVGGEKVARMVVMVCREGMLMIGILEA